MDTYNTSIVLIDIQASVTDIVRLTTDASAYTYDGELYAPTPSIKIDKYKNTGDLSDQEFKLNNIPILDGFLTYIANHMPYSEITVTVTELLDGTPLHHYKGKVYQALPEYGTGYMSLICRTVKYYTDLPAGVPCTEQCACLYFGDKLCGKTVYSEVHGVAGVSGAEMTISSDPYDSTTLLFNKGYVEFGSVRIKIKYHSSGRVFQLSKYPPSSWVGESVTIYAGCDRRIQTCKGIHNNEERFMGLGYSMVDYNALYENP